MQLPWWAKIALKLALARLPLPYPAWRRLPVFRHGAMDRPHYAYDVFRSRYDAASNRGIGAGFTALELGPGDSVFSAMLVRAFGGDSCWLVDVGDFATHDMQRYRAMARYLQERGHTEIDLGGVKTRGQLLERLNATYLTDGLDSLRAISDKSIDFIWSVAVLEHVRRRDFATVSAEMMRILHPVGICSHQIDLRDHLDGGLNNLRFAEALWEHPLVASAGFYTNRIRYAEMLEHFRAVGFGIDVVQVDRWSTPPTARHVMAAPFRTLSDQELCILGFDVVLYPLLPGRLEGRMAG